MVQEKVSATTKEEVWFLYSRCRNQMIGTNYKDWLFHYDDAF